MRVAIIVDCLDPLVCKTILEYNSVKKAYVGSFSLRPTCQRSYERRAILPGKHAEHTTKARASIIVVKVGEEI